MTKTRRDPDPEARLGLAALAVPFRELAILLAMPVFGLLFTIGIIGGIPGHALGLLTLPAFFAFLLRATEAKRNQRPVEPPNIEMFTLAEGALGLLPLLVCVVAGTGIYQLVASGAPLYAGVALFAFQATLPLVLAHLVLTGNALASISPLALVRILHVLGADYLIVLASSLAAAMMVFIVLVLEPPLFFRIVAVEYWFFVVAVASGIGLWRNSNAFDIDLEINTDRALLNQAQRTDQAREAILSRAYGFASHSNKIGAVKLLLEEIRAGGPDADEFARYMDAVFEWDISDVSLIFACHYLEWLLQEGDDLKACKLLQRCRHQDSNFDLRHVDKQLVLEAAKRTGNQEIADWLTASARLTGI